MSHAPLSHSRRGFTIVEAMIVMGIIALLVGILLLALGGVRKGADIAAERQFVQAIKTGVEQFKSEFGFLPPLVMDTPDPSQPTTGQAPADNTDRIIIWSTLDLGNADSTANGSPGPSDRARRQSFSKYSLVYYLAGSLDDKFDEVNGLGFTAPSTSRDGSFSRRGRKHEPLFDPTLHKTRTGKIRYHGPTTAFVDDAAVQAARAREMYILYRGFPGATEDVAIRYYRWLPSFYPKTHAKAGQIQYWNVPIAVGGDVADATIPPAKIELKSAEWAVVSPGPDGIFGDEDITLIRNTLDGLNTVVGGTTDDDYRRKAASDNIVEVGR